MAEPAFRPLDPVDDRALVADLYARAADYVGFETGLSPGDNTVDEFFTGAPPGGDPADADRPGLFVEGRLMGIAELAFGYPDPADAYLGLMLLDPEARGQGLGRRYLGHVIDLARARQAPRLYLGVLDGNARGRAFWEREGFRVVLTTEPVWTGERLHVRHRMLREL